MENKRHAGVTLVEILIAVGILAVTVGSVLGVFLASARANSASRKITIASFTAQLYMEELVGLTERELREKFADEGGDAAGNPILLEKDSYNGFFLRATVDFSYDFSGRFELDTGYPLDALAFARVEISESDGSPVLSGYENVLRVAP